jgi:hypothetical protein
VHLDGSFKALEAVFEFQPLSVAAPLLLTSSTRNFDRSSTASVPHATGGSLLLRGDDTPNGAGLLRLRDRDVSIYHHAQGGPSPRSGVTTSVDSDDAQFASPRSKLTISQIPATHRPLSPAASAGLPPSAAPIDKAFDAPSQSDSDHQTGGTEVLSEDMVLALQRFAQRAFDEKRHYVLPLSVNEAEPLRQVDDAEGVVAAPPSVAPMVGRRR